MLLTSFYTYKKPHKDSPKPLANFGTDQVVPNYEGPSKAPGDEMKDKDVVAGEEPVKQVDQVDAPVEQQPNQPDQPEQPDEETVDHPDKPVDQLDKPVDETVKPADQPANQLEKPDEETVKPDKPVDQSLDETVKSADQPDKLADKPVEAKETDKGKDVSKVQTAPASESPPPATPPRIPPRNQKPHTDVTDLAILVRKILSVSEKVASVVSELKKQEGSYGRQTSVSTPIAESAPTSFDFYMKAMKPLQFGERG